jgi:aspartyl-tRNA(Asn)/glutamyl-tRNA(Gln) amidotransferase subunit A
MSVLDSYRATLAGVAIGDADGLVPLEPACDVHGHARDTTPTWVMQGANPAPAAAGTVLDLSQRMDRGDVTSVDLVSEILERVPESTLLEAGWAYLDDAALDAARASDRRRELGVRLSLLDGIPVAVKDLIHVAGQPTGCGSAHGYEGVATDDALCIARLREAGAVIVGKATTHEFAFGGTTPPTRNPWDPDRIPGGSSGGSGAVVGAGWVPVAIGTDTAGSVRIPASYCGTVGFIGTRQDVPTQGVATLAWSLDTVGPLTRSVRDAAVVNAVMAGREPEGSIPRPALPATVGLPARVLGPLDPGVESAFDAALAVLRQGGVATVDVDWPDEDVLQAVGFILMMAESADFHRQRMSDPGKFDAEVAELLVLGSQISATDYIRAKRIQAHLTGRLLKLLERVPVIITPTLPCKPAPYGSGTFTPLPLGDTSMPLAAAHTRYPLLANVAGLPAGTVPCGFASGLPVGLHVMGAPGEDETVLSVMAGIEAVLADAGAWRVGSTAAAHLEEEGRREDA